MDNKEDGKFLTGSDDNDSINNRGSNVTIAAGAGDDTVYNSGDNVSINGGDGNDLITNINEDIPIVIGNVPYDKKIYADINIPGKDDSVVGNGLKATLLGGAGDDSIENSGDNALIYGGTGNNLISLIGGAENTVNAAQGADTIRVSATIKSFTVEDFGTDDVIRLSTTPNKLELTDGGIIAGNVTIGGITSIASGENFWQTYSESISYQSSQTSGASLSGNEIRLAGETSADTLFTITGLSSTVGVSLNDKEVILTNAALANRALDTISISDGYTLQLASDVDTVAENLTGWQTMTGGNVAYISGGVGEYYSLSSDKQIVIYTDSTAGNNRVEFSGVRGEPTLSGGVVSLTAENFASNVKVESNAGKYRFALSGEIDKSFTGTRGNDSIYNNGNYVTINTAQGKDTIRVGATAKNFAVSGFGTNDLIRLSTTPDKLELVDGGILAGNVTIGGINSIASGENFWQTYSESISYESSQTSGASLSGNEIRLAGETSADTLFTITGLNSTIGVSLNDKEVVLTNVALANRTLDTITISDDYTLQLASDVDTVAEDLSGWQTLTGGNVAYYAGGVGEYYSLSSDKQSVTYTDSTAGNNRVEFSGVRGEPTLGSGTVSLTAENFASNVKVESNAGKYQFALSGEIDKSFTGTRGNDSIYNNGNFVTINTAQGKDTIRVGATARNFAVSGFGTNDLIRLSTTPDKLELTDGGIVAGNVTIGGINSIASGENFWQTYSESISYQISQTSGASLSGNEIRLAGETSADTLFTITGLNSTVGVSLNDKEVVLTNVALANRTLDTITISDDYTLQLASDVDTVAEDLSGWQTLTGGNVAYYAGGVGEYYSLSSDKQIVTYTDETAGNNRVELSGVRGEPTLSSGVVSLTADNFASNVKVESNAGKYQFALSGEIDKSFTGTRGNDSILNDSNGVTINTSQGSDTIRVVGATARNFAVAGFGTNDVIKLSTTPDKLELTDGGIVAGNVTIGGINSIASGETFWQTYSESISYQSSQTSGASLSGNEIRLAGETSADTLFTITGLNSTVGVSLNDKEVILSNAALANRTLDTITISEGYTLQLASDVDTVAENLTGWQTLTGGNVAYYAGGVGEYYSLSSDKQSVIYADETAGNNRVELSGVQGEPTLSGGVVSLTAENFASNVKVESNAGNYAFNLSGDFDDKKFAGTADADTITNAGANLTINGGAGDDLISLKSSNNFIQYTAGEGNDTIYSRHSGTAFASVNGNKQLEVVLSGNDTLYTVDINSSANWTPTVSGNDVIVEFDDSSLTLKNVSISIGGGDSSINGDDKPTPPSDNSSSDVIPDDNPSISDDDTPTVEPVIVNPNNLSGMIHLAQWSFGFEPPAWLFNGSFGSPALQEISTTNSTASEINSSTENDFSGSVSSIVSSGNPSNRF